LISGSVVTRTRATGRFLIRLLSACTKQIIFCAVALVLTTTVNAQQGSIGAGTCTPFNSNGTCSLILAWGTTGVSAAEVWVHPAVGNQQKLFTGTNGSQQLNWIQALPQHYDFILYQTIGGNRGPELSRTRVAISSILSVDVQPSGSQTLNHGQTMAFTITVRDPNGHLISGANVAIVDGVQGGVLQNVTTNASGQATYGYSIPTLVPPNTYTMTFGPATKAGYNQSGTTQRQVTVNAPPSSLSLEVQPSGTQTVNPGQAVNYSITVRDSAGNGVNAAAVPVANPLIGNTSVTTGAGGTVSYNFTVPTGASPGNHTLSFGNASKSGYISSGIVQRTVAVSGPQPLLTLEVQPTATQIVSAGATVDYTVTVKDNNGAVVSGASVTVTNPFLGTDSTVTTGSAGTTTYSLPVPSNRGAGTVTVFFSGASKSGYVASSGTQRQITVQPATAPTAVLSLSAQNQTVGNGGTLTLSTAQGGSVQVNLNATGSTPGSGTISAYAWTSNGTAVGNGQASFAMPFGVASHDIALTVTNSVGLSNTATARIVVRSTSSSGASGTITAPSCTVPTSNGQCNVTVSWTTHNVQAAQVWGVDSFGTQTPIASGLQGSKVVSIDAPPRKHIFQLWDYSNGTRGALLDQIQVQAQGPSAPVTSSNPTVNVLLSKADRGASFPITGSNFTRSQSVNVIIKPPNAQALPANVNADATGDIAYNFVTNSSTPTGIYQVSAIDTATGKQSDTASFTVNAPNPAQTFGQTGCLTSGCSADPINTSTGNYMYTRTDLALPGRGLPFAFTRFYNSLDGTPGPIGAGWTHSYMASLIQNPNDQSVTIRMGDGQVIEFDFAGGLYEPRHEGIFHKLEVASNGDFLMTTRQLMSYRFRGGRLTAISERNGNTIRLSYTGGNLTTITDTISRSIQLTYDPAGRLITLSDSLGRVLQYGYNSAGDLTHFADARGGRFAFTYDAAHRMLTATDPEDNVFLRNEYDADGRVAAQSDGAGNRWTYAYNKDTGTTTITDPLGRVSRHTHDPKFQLVRDTDPTGKTTEYLYNHRGNRIQVNDRNGGITRLSYDPKGNVLVLADARGGLQSATYDDLNNPLTSEDPLRNQATFSYDARGNLISVTDPASGRSTVAYDQLGQVTARTDAEGRITRFAYDGAGNVIEETDPLGNKTTHTYDLVGRRLTTADANGFTTTFAYDASDNLLSVIDPLSGKIQYTYDGNNNRTSLTDQRGKATTFAYNTNYQLVTTTDVLGNKIVNTYDRLRNLATVTDPLGNTSRYSYDTENRLIRLTDAIGNVTAYEYDANGNRTKITDPLGNQTSFTFDPVNRPVSRKDALGHETRTEYDLAGRVLKRTDEVGNTTTFTYDALGRQVKVRDAAGGEVSFQYDKVGNRTAIIDTRGKITRFTYDQRNQLLTTTNPLGNVTRNRYDAIGNLVQVIDGNGNSKSYEYDSNRRQRKISYSTGGSVQFEYDAAGNRTRMIDLIGESTYAYDDLNRLMNYRNPWGATLGYSYDAASNRTVLRYPGDKPVAYTYEANNRISKVRDWNGFEATYAYDAAGRVSSVRYTNAVTSQYIYDAGGQNLRIEHRNATGLIYSEATTWSPNGNPISSDISGLTSPGLPSETTTYTYNDANQLALTNYGAPVHDRNGNLVQQPGFGGATTLVYDLNNRATSISGPTVNTTMKYFGDGKIAELNTPNELRRTLLDPTAAGNRILAELDGSDAMQVGYAYGPVGMISQIAAGQTYAYLHNLQSSTVALADASGSIRNSYGYDPFGQRLLGSSEQVANSFTFLGSYSAPTVERYSITPYRVYNSREGRFTGEDAAFPLQPALSQYIYVGQSPVKLIDPSGLVAEKVSKALGLGGDAFTIAEELLKRKLLVVNSNTGRFDVVNALPTNLKSIDNIGDYLSAAAALVDFYREAATGTNRELALARAFQGLSVDATRMLVGELCGLCGAVDAAWSISTNFGWWVGSQSGGILFKAINLAGQGDRFIEWSSRPSWIDNVTVEKLNPWYWAERGLNWGVSRLGN